jgi:hypothetical protein
MRDRTAVYAALSGVVAPAATIRFVGHAHARGLVDRPTALVVLVAGPVACGLLLLGAGWVLGVHGRDPLDRVRERPTVRDRVPDDAERHLSEKTLDQPASEGMVPPGLFRHGLLYCLVVPVVALVVLS